MFPIYTKEALHPHCEKCHSKMFMIKQDPCSCMIIGCPYWYQTWECQVCHEKWERIEWGHPNVRFSGDEIGALPKLPDDCNVAFVGT